MIHHLPKLFALLVLSGRLALAQDPSAAVCAERSPQPLSRSAVFVHGYEALERPIFEEAADWMQCADENWREEDYYGEELEDEVAYVRVNRYLAKPYLPRYYLGKSLGELGCFDTAEEKLDKTLLRDPRSSASRREKRLKKERDEYRRKVRECRDEAAAEEFCRRRGADCSRWPRESENRRPSGEE